MSQNCEESSVLDQIVTTFNGLYRVKLNTVLVGGAAEPLYQPASPLQSANIIYFTRDYPASALHEIAHWCIAGDERRGKVDYGYWYEPDGRSDEQQQRFEQVEIKPQAVEWMLSRSCAMPFRLSSDNLNSEALPSDGFKLKVCKQAQTYCKEALPENAKELMDAFRKAFDVECIMAPEMFTLETLNW